MNSLPHIQLHRILLPILFLCTAAIVYFSIKEAEAKKEHMLRVYFLDIGQGDATLIESPSGTQILIDGGPDSSVLRELGQVMEFFDKDIDMVVATHPDKDHIGGLIGVLERYEVKAVLLTENESETPVSESFLELVDKEGADVFFARSGQTFVFDNASLHILFPDRDASDLESNTSSIVAQLSYGDIDFIFTGDSPQAIEKYLVEVYGSSLKSEVLKVGHHGSRTSTAEAFASAVDPEYAVISAGKENSYGHPHKEVLDILSRHGIEIQNTAEIGSIVFESDGTMISIRE